MMFKKRKTRAAIQASKGEPIRVVILGAGGRDFHNFNTFRRSVCDSVVISTPTDLRRRIRIDRPVVRVTYDFDIDLAPWVEGLLRELRFS